MNKKDSDELDKILYLYYSKAKSEFGSKEELIEFLKNHFSKATKLIFCEFYLCIYNKNSECSLISTNISPTGFCAECIIPHIEKETLEKCKQITRDNLERFM